MIEPLSDRRDVRGDQALGLDAEPGVGAESSFEQGFTGSHLRLVNLLVAELYFRQRALRNFSTKVFRAHFSLRHF
jgi:hypothetical protein